MHRQQIWRHATIRLIPCAALFIGGAIVSTANGNVRYDNIDHKFIALIGVCVFLVFATVFLHILTAAVHGLIASHRLGVGRAGAVQFILRTFGYVAILLATLQLVGIPVGRILLGSAVLGIILGVAAQQALANFFASFILILAHPFIVGEEVTLNSGALGGKHEGTVLEIGLTHTRLEEKNGDIVFLPNATILSGAAITPERHKIAPVKADS